ncbi:MAG: ABC transporter ATP-binding protein [Alkalinema sp. CACIAM 70d]|nr:MAG: ABC transporter ATP-binding protein [Alkalinema sp. CACIAM 70d]
MNSPNPLLLKYIRRYPGWIVLTILLGFSSALFNGVSTALIAPILLNFLGQAESMKGLPPVIEKTLRFAGLDQNPSAIVLFGVILAAIVLKNAASYASTLSSTHLIRLLTNGMRRDALRLLLQVDLDFFTKSKVGDLVNRIGSEVGQSANALKATIGICINIITIFVFLTLLLAISWKLTIISTALLSLVAIANQYFVRRAKRFGYELSNNSRLYSVKLLEILNGIRLIKATSNESAEYDKIERMISDREKADFQSQANFAIVGPVNEVAGIITILLIVILGRSLFADQIAATSALLLSYLLLLFRMLPVIGQLNSARNTLANATPSLAIVEDLLRSDNKPLMPQRNLYGYQGLETEIRFDQVSFAYPGQENPILRQISLTIPKGKTVALVGASGAGKSTIADLLTRFYDPTEGWITLDGQDLRDFDLRSLRRAMGVVSQDTFLFNDTIRNNIAYACPDVTEAEIIAAAQRANAYEFIQKLPQGLDTLIGDRGVLLSGGQRQRLAIARALLRDPEILILDEATSALDTVSERLVQQAIDDLSRDRTTLVIAHRLSTIQKAHQVVALDRGRVVEQGTHTELLQQGGYYAKLCAMQFSDSSHHAPLDSNLPTQDSCLDDLASSQEVVR